MQSKYEYKSLTFFIRYEKMVLNRGYKKYGEVIDSEISSILNEQSSFGWRTISINHTDSESELMVNVVFEREIFD